MGFWVLEVKEMWYGSFWVGYNFRMEGVFWVVFWNFVDFVGIGRSWKVV